MNSTFNQQMQQELDAIAAEGLFKKERVITGPQGSVVDLATGQHLINLCANNYLGLSSHPEVIQAAKDALDTHGFGMSSVRFICGTQDLHKTLEQKIADFYGTEDTILYAAAFDANGGVFEPLLGAEDAIVSDALNHASIIDGIRLCKAQRYRYANGDLVDLEIQLKQARAQGAKNILIVTDGVFSMDGLVAPLDGICDLADQYNALVMVDECHAAGFLGTHGRGSLEAKGVMGRVDIITGTLGKALGGAMGGYTTASKPIVEMLRQRSRPYLFSNSLAPSIVGASIKVFELIDKDTSYRDRLMENTAYFRAGIKSLGFDIIEGEAAIIPIMLYEATLAQEMAARLMDHGVYVIGFFYPVVPKGKARIRVQLSAALSRAELDRALEAFKTVGQSLNII
ncbi:MAG: glycine C-acetyltransferase [Flavobacteriaceae bacterium]|nr:glycine C-acetyltransferase [Flavobacteriaceae bacterium]MDP4674430.1 glycine C-acetyltransferase [Flavobacteriaceae bacterium]MDP4754293.1 glycine C-acetyltransferase [Flavobacteriaceae bacterium]MDP4970889.1 glycine C-acetyltransferase [Flavobacteriaceae bacterium]MDP5112792.1 glycine C-acetyltransferase [Flavobacteriaceae bacterium]